MRRLDWEDRLADLIAARRDVPFKWGENDCALWGADCVEAILGVDFGQNFRGQYEDQSGARLALRQFGAGSLFKTFDRHLTRILPAFAQRGDLVAKGRGRTAAIGVCIGSDAVFVGEDGLVMVPRLLWTAGWRVTLTKWWRP